MTTDQDGVSVFNLLAKRIKLEGAITIADFMADVLVAPKHGYYMSGEPFGKAGDFITAPEVSQMFGELIGVWCADTWYNMGGPTSLNLVELGPGRGTLMADMLRAAGMVPGFLQTLQVHLIEISPSLKKKQKQTLAGYNITWHQDLTTLPEGPTIFIANEFFDALPIKQFERSPKGWCERLITLNEDEKELIFTLSPPSKAIESLIPQDLRSAEEGAVVELSPIASTIIDMISRHILDHGGAALLIDYGRDVPTAIPSLQAIKAHKKHSVLKEPGTADISALVDFPTLVSTALKSGVAAHGPITQGDFLRSLGIEQRAEMLRKTGTDEQIVDITSAEHRLIDTNEMGTLFKVLSLTHPNHPTPATFPEHRK
ncbi:class I SAM-dependent methyltransferase [Kiloniella antarctica]|uniref:Class I SAM-dependent methyltransferase n=1 Tax=Kiloniella antarctica TaxID=1550907 RepID=A0ABW5BF55_9PROT